MMAEESTKLLSTPPSPSQSLGQVTDTADCEEKRSSSSSASTTSTPPWLRWSRGLHSLLEDQEGVELFEIYLSQEGCSVQLNFLWACEGLKSTGSDDPPKIPQLIRSIYRNLIQNSNLLGLSEETRSTVAQSIKDGKFSTEIFDKAQEEVEAHMRDNLYPNFIKSEIFLSVATGELHTSSTIEDAQKLGGSTSSVSGGSGNAPGGAGVSTAVGSSASVDSSSTERILSGSANKFQIDPLTGEVLQSRLADGELSPHHSLSSPPSTSSAANLLNLLPNILQTVHEDKELSVNPHNASSTHNAKLKLTKEGLLATQLARASAVTVPGATPVIGNGKVRKGETVTGHYHANKGNLSVAPFPYYVMYSPYNPVSRVDSEVQSMSSDAMTDDGGHPHHQSSVSKKHSGHHHKVPHYQMPPSSRNLEKISQFQSGAAGLVPNKDTLPSYPVHGREPKGPNREEVDPIAFAATLIRKLEEVKKNREVEEKLNRRISERDECPAPTEELTPHLLAAAIREKLQVQDDARPDDILDKHVSRVWSDDTPDAKSPKLRSPTVGRRRGAPVSCVAIHRRRERDGVSTFSADSGNVNDYAAELPSSPSIVFMPKSKSVPYELKSSDAVELSQFPSSMHAQRGRPSRGGLSDPRKISSTMLTKKSSSEFIDSGVSVISGTAPTSTAPTAPAFSYDWSKHTMVHQWVEQACDEKPRAKSITSPSVSRRQKKVSSIGGSQSQAPLPPIPMFEEVCRRLSKKPPTYPAQPQLPGTYSSTLPRRHHSQSSQEESVGATEYSVSSFVFYEDSEVPYGFKIPCKSRTGGITLAVFKEHLPKRGNFRFFFKKECAELDAKVVQEEVTDDCQILPLYESKIIAHLQAATATSGTSLQNPPLFNLT